MSESTLMQAAPQFTVYDRGGERSLATAGNSWLNYASVSIKAAPTRRQAIIDFSQMQPSLAVVLLGLLLLKYSQSCYDDCGGNRTTLAVAADYRRAAYNFSNCFCDKLCAVYGDCCHDAPITADRSPLQFTCGRLTGAITLSGLPLSVYYVQKCTDTLDEDTQRKCQAPELTNGDISERLPVHFRTESQGLLVFRNRYCAQCNGVTQYESWNAALSCDVIGDADEEWRKHNSKNLSAATIYAALLSGNTNGLGTGWSVVYKPKRQADEDALPYCKAPLEVVSCKNAGSNLTSCLQGPVAYRYREKEGAIYRNNECALCVGVKNAKPCHTANRMRVSSSLPMSLTILFDMVDDLPVHMRAIGAVTSVKQSEKLYAQDDMRTDKRFAGRNQLDVNDSDWQESNVSLHQEHHAAAGVEVGLSITCMIISIVALCVNIAAIIWTGSHRRSFGSTLMLLLCVTLIFHYLLFFGFSAPGTTLCVIRGVLLDASTKSVFLCMQVLIFDILRAMWPSKSGTGMHDSVKRADQRKRFLRYCVYVFGLPWLFVVPGLVLDSVNPTALVAPLYGVHVCYISSKYGILVFQYVPVCVFFVINLVLCALTIKYIRGIKKMRNVALGKSDANPNDKESREQTYLYMRLVLLAGITWTFGLVNAFWGGYVLRILTILSDGLLGLFIAVSYLGSRSVRMILIAKLCGSYEPTTTATNVPSSSSGANSRKQSMPNKRPSAAGTE